MSILVLAEQVQGRLRTATLSTIAAAARLGDDIHVLIAGEGVSAVAAEAAAVAGVTKVMVADAAAYAQALAEPLAALTVTLADGYTHLLAPATTFGKNILPRVAALKDVAMISDVCGIEDAETFVRPIYAGNALATVKSADRLKIMTIRTTAFDPVATTGGAATVEALAEPSGELALAGRSRFVSEDMTHSARPELSSARVVVAGGRGLGAADQFKLVESLADRLGGAVGATRAAVDAGYISNDSQIGQTGKIVAPELYIAVGISGAIQHVAGMKDSKVIVAINKDEDAPIFQVADYALVGDLFEVVPALLAELDKQGIGVR